MLNPSRPVTAGLLEWQRRAAAGDVAAYSMLYAQGATFWAAVDDLLLASGSPSGLDSILPELVRAGFDSRSGVRPELLTRIPETARPAYSRLVARYVGQ